MIEPLTITVALIKVISLKMRPQMNSIQYATETDAEAEYQAYLNPKIIAFMEFYT